MSVRAKRVILVVAVLVLALVVVGALTSRSGGASVRPPFCPDPKLVGEEWSCGHIPQGTVPPWVGPGPVTTVPPTTAGEAPESPGEPTTTTLPTVDMPEATDPPESHDEGVPVRAPVAVRATPSYTG